MTVIDVVASAPAVRRRPTGIARRAVSVRLGVRLARRELRRRPWRTALVLLMVFVPTLAMTGVVTALRTAQWSSTDQHLANYGQADLMVTGARNRPTPADLSVLRAALPAGSRLLSEGYARDRVRHGDRRTYLDLSDVGIDDPVARGRFGPLDGRAARTGAEVVLTRSAARALHVSVGERIHLDRLDRTVRVVGTVLPRVRGDIAYFGAPLGAHAELVTTWVALPGVGVGDRVDAPGATQGWSFSPVGDPGGDQRTSEVFWTYVGGGVGLVVLATVITAAFAVGARRQLRSVGLLSASGASPTTVKWFLVAQGAVAGLLGSLLGIAAVLVGSRFVPERFLEAIASRPVTGPKTVVADLLPILVLGTVVAAVAAWIPARSTARVPTLRALAGRRPLSRVPVRLPVIGAVAVAGGCALLAMAVAGARGGGSSLWALVAIAGSLGVLLGAIAIAPWCISGLERTASALPGSWRLAARSLARSRVRSSAVVGAICAVAAVVVAGGTLYASLNPPSDDGPPWLGGDQAAIDVQVPTPGSTPANAQYRFVPVPADVARRVEAVAPGTELLDIPRAVPPTTSSNGDAPVMFFSAAGPHGSPALGDLQGRGNAVAVASPALLDYLEVPTDLRRALAGGAAIATVRLSPAPTAITLTAPGQASVPFGGSFASPHATGAMPRLLLNARTAKRAGLRVARHQVESTFAIFPSTLSGHQRSRLDLLAEDLQWEGSTVSADELAPRYVNINVPAGPPLLTRAQIKLGLLVLSLVLVLAVVAVGLALAAQDSADERQVLEAVGAPAKVLRRVNALRALLLAAMAGLIAVPAGLFSAASVVAAADGGGHSHRSLRPDGWGILFVLLVTPLAVGVITWFGGRVRDVVRPRRPDVFAFDD